MVGVLATYSWILQEEYLAYYRWLLTLTITVILFIIYYFIFYACKLINILFHCRWLGLSFWRSNQIWFGFAFSDFRHTILLTTLCILQVCATFDILHCACCSLLHVYCTIATVCFLRKNHLRIIGKCNPCLANGSGDIMIIKMNVHLMNLLIL